MQVEFFCYSSKSLLGAAPPDDEAPEEEPLPDELPDDELPPDEEEPPPDEPDELPEDEPPDEELLPDEPELPDELLPDEDELLPDELLGDFVSVGFGLADDDGFSGLADADGFGEAEFLGVFDACDELQLSLGCVPSTKYAFVELHVFVASLPEYIHISFSITFAGFAIVFDGKSS